METTDYEEERLRNIRENEKLMMELGVLNGSKIIGPPVAPSGKPQNGAAKKRAKPVARKKQEPIPRRIMPTRSSARLQGQEADSETLKRKYEAEAEQARMEAEAAKKARHGQFDLSQLTGGELEAESIHSLKSVLSDVASVELKSQVPYVEGKDKREDEEEAEPSRERKELVKILDKMTLRSSAKVTPKRVYSMAYHPSTEKDLIFVGDKEGTIGVWDASAPNEMESKPGEVEDEEDQEASFPEGKSWSLQAHGRSPVTSLKFDPCKADSLFSACYDSTIRNFSLATGKSDEVWAGDEDVLLSVFDVLSPSTHPSAFTDTPAPSLDERSIWVADHRGGLIHLDLREDKRIRQQKSRRWQVCEKKIGAMSVNPLAPHCIATASLDQHVRLFDVRALQSLAETSSAPYNSKGVDINLLEEAQTKAQFASHKARQACTSVDFSPRGNQLVGVSYDDVVKVWDLEISWLYSSQGAKLNGSKGSKSAKSKPPIKDEPGKKRSNTIIDWINRKPKGGKGPDEMEKVDELVPVADRPEDLLAEPIKIPHNNQTGKWLTLFRARWNQNPNVEPHFTMGSMSRRAEIYASDGKLLRSLWDEDIVTAVPAVTCTHPSETGKLATGNASGRCTWWAPVESE
ncbi:WD40 repeat-like protein [Violaceomyces palustris]|uniref:WD40 repeat-like protein n=1 Tax=Violaceomyces palustris TaxID=1673888 RepID=A0ACD0P7U6_9BASI|nr:WD40 repeat-like protein [Violaceomyces palustris]